MEVSELKKGDQVKITHSRKGTFDAEITSNADSSEWLGTKVLNKKVVGMVNEWIPGEDLTVRKTLIINIEKL